LVLAMFFIALHLEQARIAGIITTFRVEPCRCLAVRSKRLRSSACTLSSYRLERRRHDRRFHLLLQRAAVGPLIRGGGASAKKGEEGRADSVRVGTSHLASVPRLSSNAMSNLKPWDTLASENVGDFRIFRLRKDRCRSPRTLNEHDFYVIEAPDWCNVIALTPDDQVVLVRQYRFGIRAATLEIPGGMVDGDEDPTDAARRELLEETGFACDQIEPLARTLPNPAIQNNVCHMAVATGCRRIKEPSLDEREDIEVLTRPLAEMPRLISNGEISHALVVVAFHHLFQKRSQKIA
jgi:ADP-ribose pyrophosphatase